MKRSPIAFTLLAGLALAATAQGQLFSDDFESYTPDTNLTTEGAWGRVSGVSGTATMLVRDESTADPFGTSPNQYLEYNDSSTGASIRIQSSNIAAASGAVTTLAFDFVEPSTGGASELRVGLANQSSDLNGPGQRLRINLDDGTIGALSSSASNTYSLDTAYRVYMIFNDSASTVTYSGGTIAPQVADIWIEPSGGSAVFAGTRTATNSQTASYQVALRSYSSSLQGVLVDNVVLHAGVALPGNPPALASTNPADDAIGVSVAADLVAAFDRSIEPGTGNITIHRTADDATVGTFDVATSPDVTITGSTLTINPPSDLTLNTGYYVLIPGTAIENVIGEPFAGISATTAWSFMTSSDNPPSLVSTSPADDTTDVALGTNLALTLDEDAFVGTGSITITNLSESTAFATIDIDDTSQVTIVGDTITIDPATDLREGRSYAVEIDNGAVVDSSGNPFTGITGTSDWNFSTIADLTNPTLASTNPGDDTTKASPFNDLVATFDEAIQAGTGDIIIKNLSAATTIATIPIGDAKVSFSGKQLTINPSANLPYATEIAIQIAPGAITDLSGNPYAGISNDTAWNFLTTFLSSRDQITGEAQVNANPAGYYPGNNNNQIGTGGATNSREDKNVVFGLTLPTLAVGETVGSVDFSFEITAARDSTGASNLPDLQVYVLDTDNPNGTGTSFFYHGPADPSRCVALAATTSVTVTGTSENTFADDSEDRVVTLTGDALTMVQSFYGGDHIPDQPEVFFRFNLDVDPSINTFRRYRLDVSSGEVDLQVTPAPASAPVIASTLPADDAPAAPGAGKLVVTFDRAIQAGTGNITIKNLTDATTFATIPVGDAQVSIAGTDLVIDPASDLDPLKEYAVQLDQGVVENLVGQPFGGIVDPNVTTWNFTTGTTMVAALSSTDYITGRAQAAGQATGYYTSTGSAGQVGAGGGTNARVDRNVVLGFTLPTLEVGATLQAADLHFEITAYRNFSGADPALNVYLLDSADPNSTGIAFFYHGPCDPATNVAFVGETDITNPPNAQISFDDDAQDQSYVISGEALALLQSLYGGDHIPDQTEVFFRFNLDNLIIGTGDADLNGSIFDRYFIDYGATEASLDLTSTAGTTDPYLIWAASEGLAGPDAEPGANPDSDDFTNLEEFAYGTDPEVSDSGPLSVSPVVRGAPTTGVSFGPLDFDALFMRRTTYVADGLVYTIQFSADLQSWADSTETPTVVADDGDYEVVEVPYEIFLPGGQKARFFRVQVTLN